MGLSVDIAPSLALFQTEERITVGMVYRTRKDDRLLQVTVFILHVAHEGIESR